MLDKVATFNNIFKTTMHAESVYVMVKQEEQE